MTEEMKKKYLKEFDAMALPEVLTEAMNSKKDYDQPMFDLAMIAIFNKITAPNEPLDFSDDMDAEFAKAMIKVVSVGLLDALDDFDANPMLDLLNKVSKK